MHNFCIGWRTESCIAERLESLMQSILVARNCCDCGWRAMHPSLRSASFGPRGESDISERDDEKVRERPKSPYCSISMRGAIE